MPPHNTQLPSAKTAELTIYKAGLAMWNKSMNSYGDVLITVDGIRSPVKQAMKSVPPKNVTLSFDVAFRGVTLIFFFASPDKKGTQSRTLPIPRSVFCLISRSGLMAVRTKMTTPATASSIFNTFLGSLSL